MYKNEDSITNKYLIEACGFKPIPHFTIGDSVTYDLGRNRYLSVNSAGTPNEMLFLCEREPNKVVVNNLIVLSNYDYDGLLTVKRVDDLIELLTSPKSK
tara:strand:- start:21205 stop:21501 length:297 start_codon:yes stop_codon:yes gene_type:complete